MQVEHTFLGGDRSGADVMRRRNDENSVRVSNLSEDARDPDPDLSAI